MSLVIEASFGGEMNRGVYFFASIFPAISIMILFVSMESATVVSTPFAALIVTSFIALFVARSPGLVAEFGLTAFAAGGIFPAALFAGLLRDDGNGAAFGALLEVALAELGIFLTFLAGAKILAFGDGGSA